MREEKEVWIKRTQWVLTCDQCGKVVETATTCSICERNICKECWSTNNNRKIDKTDVLYDHACDFCMTVEGAAGMITAMVELRNMEQKALDDRYDIKELWKKLSRGFHES